MGLFEDLGKNKKFKLPEKLDEAKKKLDVITKISGVRGYIEAIDEVNQAFHHIWAKDHDEKIISLTELEQILVMMAESKKGEALALKKEYESI